MKLTENQFGKSNIYFRQFSFKISRFRNGYVTMTFRKSEIQLEKSYWRLVYYSWTIKLKSYDLKYVDFEVNHKIFPDNKVLRQYAEFNTLIIDS